MKKALIFRGGWEGHAPIAVSERIAEILLKHDIHADIFDGVQCLCDREKLLTYDLIVPCITMGDAPEAYIENLSYAVSQGVGLAGCHGGMCDAFRNSPLWQFITGGQWVAHPGNDGVTYTVNIGKEQHPITEGIGDFTVCSEQYYLHIDPAVKVLATTRFQIADGLHAANMPIDMPVIWTKLWGEGRVFYSSLGHNEKVFDACPEAELLLERGLVFACRNEKTI